QRQDSPIESCEFSSSVDCKSKKVGIGNLLVSHELSRERLNGLHKTDVILPEAVSRMAQIGLEQNQCLRRSERIGGEGRVGDDAHKGTLRERACCPPLPRVTRQPLLDPRMGLMRRPGGGDKNVNVQ